MNKKLIKRRFMVQKDHLELIFKSSDALHYPKIAERVKLACTIMYATGMRISNLMYLDQAWFEKNILASNADGFVAYPPLKQTLFGRNKNKSKAAYIVDIHTFIAREYFYMIKLLYTNYVTRFNGVQPFKINRADLNRQVNKVLTSIDSNFTSHSFRASLITKIAQNQGITVAKEYIGHRDIGTTQKYVITTLSKKLIQELGSSI